MVVSYGVAKRPPRQWFASSASFSSMCPPHLYYTSLNSCGFVVLFAFFILTCTVSKLLRKCFTSYEIAVLRVSHVIFVYIFRLLINGAYTCVLRIYTLVFIELWITLKVLTNALIRFKASYFYYEVLIFSFLRNYTIWCPA